MGYIENIGLLTKSVLHHRRLVSPHSSRVIDGSKNAFLVIDELALLEGSFIDNMFTLYACGIHDYKKEVLDPRQILSMMMANDNCRYDRSVKRTNGMANGKFCCVAPTDKMDLLWKSCDKVDNSQAIVADSSSIGNLRKRLQTMGVEKNKIETISDKALVAYVIANEMQFLIAIIHPFWERNGRTSEEVMHLVCATYGVDKLVFWDNVKQRYNKTTRERMDLIDKLAISLLPEVAERMGLAIGDNKIDSVHDIYKLWYIQNGLIDTYLLLDFLQKHTPLKYLQTKSACLNSQQLMQSYFYALRSVIEDRISLIAQDKISTLMEDTVNQQLVANHLMRGKEVNMHQLVNS